MKRDEFYEIFPASFWFPDTGRQYGFRTFYHGFRERTCCPDGNPKAPASSSPFIGKPARGACAEIRSREGPAQPGDNTEAALINGYGICDGYSRSFQYLCSQAGIPCRLIQGSSIRGIPHSWNMVLLNGEWLYVDTTWDESSNERPYHDYFLVSLKEMEREHFPDGSPFLPDGSGPGYYEQLGYSVQADSPTLKEDFSKAFAKQFQDFPPGKPGAVFLEVKLLGEPYLESRKAFQQHLYSILLGIHNILENNGSPYTIKTYGAIEYHFNDATRVLTLYPVAVKRNH